jgi:hypothetical protein
VYSFMPFPHSGLSLVLLRSCLGLEEPLQSARVAMFIRHIESYDKCPLS